MAGLDDVLGGGGAGTPQSKRQKRIMLALGAGAVLALIFLMQRRGAPAAAPTADTSTAAPLPASFADNGEQAAALGTAVSDALVGVTAALDANAGSQTSIAEGFATLSEHVREQRSRGGDLPPVTVNVPGPAAAVNAPTAPPRATPPPSKGTHAEYLRRLRAIRERHGANSKEVDNFRNRHPDGLA
jgi:hypothetical protein